MLRPILIVLPTGAVETPSDAAEPPPPLFVTPPGLLPPPAGVDPPEVTPGSVDPADGTVLGLVPGVTPPPPLFWPPLAASDLKKAALFTRVPHAAVASVMTTNATISL